MPSPNICHFVQILRFDTLIIWGHGHLKNARWSFLWTPFFLLKTNPPTRNQLSYIPSRSCISQGRWLFSQERLDSNTAPRWTLSQAIITPIYSSMGSFIFLKNQGLSSKEASAYLPLSLLRRYLILNFKTLQGATHFSLGVSHVYMK